MVSACRSSLMLFSWNWNKKISRFFLVLTALGIFALSSCKAPPPSQIKKTSYRQVSFAVVGDLMVHATQLKAAYKKSCDCYRFSHLFDEVRNYIATADIAIGNLETTLPGDDPKNKNRRYSGYPQFGTPDSFADAIASAGFDILTTANNHSVDKGRAGIIRTINVLDEKNISHLGTYKSQADYQKNKILIKEKNGLKIAFLDYTYGTNGLRVPNDVVVNHIEDEKIIKDLKAARQLSPDAIIVLFHFGPEYARFPDNSQKNITQLAFRHGADIVLGSHPHVLQPYAIMRVQDIYGKTKDRLVIYSLGNFISGQQRRYTDGGTIFQFTIKKNAANQLTFTRIVDIPVWVHFGGTREKRDIRILPAEVYINEKQKASKLSKTATAKLKVFYNDTSKHYKDSRERINKYLLAH